MKQYASIEQLTKKVDGCKDRKPIHPTTVIQAIYDAHTGAQLTAILAQFNSILLQFQGTAVATRNAIPEDMRRQGLIITYVDMEGNTISERNNDASQKDDEHWSLDKNWSRIDDSRSLIQKIQELTTRIQALEEALVANNQ